MSLDLDFQISAPFGGQLQLRFASLWHGKLSRYGPREFSPKLDLYREGQSERQIRRHAAPRWSKYFHCSTLKRSSRRREKSWCGYRKLTRNFSASQLSIDPTQAPLIQPLEPRRNEVNKLTLR